MNSILLMAQTLHEINEKIKIFNSVDIKNHFHENSKNITQNVNSFNNNIKKLSCEMNILYKNKSVFMEKVSKDNDYIQKNFKNFINSKELNNANKFIHIFSDDFYNTFCHKKLICDITKEEALLKPSKNKVFQINYKKISEINDVSLKENSLRLPIIDKLESIPPSLFWFPGNKKYNQGIYFSLCEGLCVQIPFPDVQFPKKDNLIRCKFYDKKLCRKNKIKMSKINKNDVKKCTFVHRGEKYNKFSSIYRCSNETFGNYKNISKDMKSLSILDVKKIMMNSSSDLLLLSIWFQNHYNMNNLTLVNLDIC